MIDLKRLFGPSPRLATAAVPDPAPTPAPVETAPAPTAPPANDPPDDSHVAPVVGAGELYGDNYDPWPPAEPWPDPCPICNRIEMWETLTGRWRCQRCDPPTRAMRWIAKRDAILAREQLRKGQSDEQ